MRIHAGTIRRCRRIVDQLHERQRPITEDVSEVVGFEPEPDREHLQQGVGNGGHALEVLGHVGPEAGNEILVEPLIRAIETQIRRLEVKAPHRVLGRQVELLTQIGQSSGEFRTDALPPTKVR